MRFYHKIILLLPALMGGLGCKKSETSQVANVLVDITIYTTDANMYRLNAVGGWVYITGGSKGIIVFCTAPGEYMAYDRTCTYQPTNGNTVVVDTGNTTIAKDTVCGSQFQLFNYGSVSKGPAAYPLKQYRTEVNGSAIHIFN